MEPGGCHRSDHLCVDATPGPGFSDTKQPGRSGHRAQHRLEVERFDASEIDDFDFDIFLMQLVRGGEGLVDHRAVSHDG